MGGFIKTPEQRELEILKNRLEKLEKRCDNFHARLDNLEDPDSLGSSVPPGSESARSSSSDKPPLTSRADSESALRGRVTLDLLFGPDTANPTVIVQHLRQPTSGPPTPDLAAQPDSTSENQGIQDVPERCFGHFIEPTQRIGVHDYASLVSCLRSNWNDLYPGMALTDPQNMIQLFVAEIQGLRRRLGIAIAQLEETKRTSSPNPASGPNSK